MRDPYLTERYLSLIMMTAHPRVLFAPRALPRVVRATISGKTGIPTQQFALSPPALVMVRRLHQMPVLARDHRVVAVDPRGYNLSDKPADAENYALTTLVEDIRAVIDHCGAASTTAVGHDWGGAIAWLLAMLDPSSVDRLVVLTMLRPAASRVRVSWPTTPLSTTTASTRAPSSRKTRPPPAQRGGPGAMTTGARIRTCPPPRGATTPLRSAAT